MAKSSVVKKIVLEIGGKELSLTPEDARGLVKALEELLGAKKTEYVPTYIPTPYVPYSPYPHWCVTSSSTTESLSCGDVTTSKIAYSGNSTSLT